jgi:hypothetical protein
VRHGNDHRRRTKRARIRAFHARTGHERHVPSIHTPNAFAPSGTSTPAGPDQEHYKSCRLRRSALPITDTELKVIAALAMIGLSSSPNMGYSTPAATGTPSTL